jgi:hypothetical protein
MFRRISLTSWLPTVLLTTALLFPCGLLAQHGGGGGHMGGGTAGGGGLSGGSGAASGLDVKDDLKDFHAVLAVQASSQQIVEYNSMLKDTAAARGELQAFEERLGKANQGTDSESRDIHLSNAALTQALEQVRAENKKFLEGFSEKQKSGLRETTRKLVKADSELAQQANLLNQQITEAKASSQIVGTAQNLERALASFREDQESLGAEMSIGVAAGPQDFLLTITPVKNLVNFANQPITITTSGVISRSSSQNGPNIFSLHLAADMSDLQQNITEVLRSALNKTETCGERIEIQSAALTPAAPASLVLINLHYERWACFGRESSELVEGNGSAEFKLTATVGADETLRFIPQIGRVIAEGRLGELLRSDSLGESLRDKIAEALLPALQDADYKKLVPSAAQASVTLRRAQFDGTGAGRLSLVFDGEIQVPSDKVAALTGQPAPGESKNSDSKTIELSTDGPKAGASQGQHSSPETIPQ